MFDVLQFAFMRHALITAVLASVACGIIGSYVVVKRITFISGGIAHAAFGGIGLGYFLGINPLLCLIPFSIASAIGIGLISKRSGAAEDSAIGMVWSMGMALGVILVGMTPGYAPDLFSYLFGNILTVPMSDIVFIAILDVVIVGVVVFLYKEFLAVCFDEEYAKVSGVPVDMLYILLLTLVALTVVILVRVVGIVLVIALLTIPAAIAKQYTTRLRSMMMVSIILSAFFTIGGLWLSYVLDLASGATIIMVSGTVFFISSIGRYIKKQAAKKVCLCGHVHAGHVTPHEQRAKE